MTTLSTNKKGFTAASLSHRVSQWGGAAFIIGNLLFLTNKLDEMSRLFLSISIEDVISGENTFLILIGQVALIIGYIAYFRVYGPRVGRSGKIMLRLFCGGGMLMAISHVGFMSVVGEEIGGVDLFIFVLIALPIMLIGLISFGIANLRWAVLRQWQWLPLITGVMGFIGFFLFSGEEMTAIFLLFRTLFAVGLIGLGFTLWLEKPTHSEVG